MGDPDAGSAAGSSGSLGVGVGGETREPDAVRVVGTAHPVVLPQPVTTNNPLASLGVGVGEEGAEEAPEEPSGAPDGDKDPTQGRSDEGGDGWDSPATRKRAGAEATSESVVPLSSEPSPASEQEAVGGVPGNAPVGQPPAASVSGNTAAGAWGDCDCGLEACNAEVRRLQAALDALVAEREELVAERTSLGCELARLLGPRKPREGVTLNDQWIAAVAAVVAERDEAQDAVRELACTIAAGQALEEAVAELAQAGAVRETASSWAAELAGEKQLLRKFIESVAALDPSRGPMDCHGLVKNARAVLAGVSGPPADTEAKP